MCKQVCLVNQGDGHANTFLITCFATLIQLSFVIDFTKKYQNHALYIYNLLFGPSECMERL